jgi:hypothetical protein
MIDAIALALLKGLAGGLGERLIKAPGDKVAIKSLAGEVKELRLAQQETQVTIAELARIFEGIASHTDGLVVTRSKIKFQPTEKTPTLGDALLNLDQEIETIRSAAVKAASLKAEAQGGKPVRDVKGVQDVEPIEDVEPAQDIKPAEGARQAPATSALSGLDHEISVLRARDNSE